jgi:hypothetical protein
MIKELARHGLDAVEAYHSDHSTGQIHVLLHLAAALNLLVTGGSDYHGRHKPDVQMGTGRNGNLHLPYELVECIKNARYLPLA